MVTDMKDFYRISYMENFKDFRNHCSNKLITNLSDVGIYKIMTMYGSTSTEYLVGVRELLKKFKGSDVSIHRFLLLLKIIQ